MQRKLMWRWLLIGVVTAAAVYFMFPLKKIHLGLDLKGGVHLVLQVNTADAVRAEVDDAMERLRGELTEKGFPPTDMRRLESNSGFIFKAAPATNPKVLDKALEDRLPDFAVSRGVVITATLRPEVVRSVKDMAVRQGLETIRNRIDQFGVAEPVIQRQGIEGDRIVVQLPGVDDPVRVKELIRATAFLEIKPVVREAPSEEALLATSNGVIPEDSEVISGDVEDLEGRVTGRDYYLLKKASVVTGRDLRTARRSQDQYNQPAVHFGFNPDGARKFEAYTTAHIGDRMAIVLDNKVRSAPVIRGVISDSGIIEGNFSIQGAEDLALVLRAGALPASITYLEERTVGPSLGRDSIVRGVRAGLAGLAAIVIFMLIYYKGSGINANLALVLNAVLLLGVLGAFKATLTLPGIAGIILTIGMAVDSNVLIFERIREELELGKTVRSAVDLGFSRALSAIIDSNLTTIISALFLFQFGTGPIKGFAVTLTIGLTVSMFTAVFVSKTLFLSILTRRTAATTLSV
ncbi:MAG: protein translocase subunit SecD [Acidobacteriota bacterium]